MAKIVDLIPFPGIFEKVKNAHLPIKTLYKFTKIYTYINGEMDWFNEQVTNLIEEYCDRDENGNQIFTEDGNSIKLKEDKVNEFHSRMTELNNLEINLPEFKFTLEELDSCDFTFEDVVTLSLFIEE